MEYEKIEDNFNPSGDEEEIANNDDDINNVEQELDGKLYEEGVVQPAQIT